MLEKNRHRRSQYGIQNNNHNNGEAGITAARMVRTGRGAADKRLTVQQWCSQNGIKPNTYYNRLRSVREQYLDSAPAIVPLATSRQTSDIHIEKEGLHISLPSDIEADTLIALVHELC